MHTILSLGRPSDCAYVPSLGRRNNEGRARCLHRRTWMVNLDDVRSWVSQITGTNQHYYGTRLVIHGQRDRRKVSRIKCAIPKEREARTS